MASRDADKFPAASFINIAGAPGTLTGSASYPASPPAEALPTDRQPPVGDVALKARDAAPPITNDALCPPAFRADSHIYAAPQ